MTVLKAKVGGQWVEVGGGDEVFVGPDDPGAAYELWYDTDDPGLAPMRRIGGQWRRVAVQSIPSGSLTAITFDTEDEDTDGFLTPPGATLTIPAGLGGIYVFSWTGYTNAEGGVVQLSLPNHGGMTPTARSNVYNAWATVTTVWPMAAGSTMNVAAWQGSGSAQNLTGRLNMYRVSV